MSDDSSINSAILPMPPILVVEHPFLPPDTVLLIDTQAMRRQMTEALRIPFPIFPNAAGPRSYDFALAHALYVGAVDLGGSSDDTITPSRFVRCVQCGKRRHASRRRCVKCGRRDRP